ncbi:hypothetical protein KYG_08120 [Acidovorax sp. NO-1]|nr:hypothetical protein KYG_08120 [Acidovorax sp. NO-1]
MAGAEGLAGAGAVPGCALAAGGSARRFAAVSVVGAGEGVARAQAPASQPGAGRG